MPVNSMPHQHRIAEADLQRDLFDIREVMGGDGVHAILGWGLSPAGPSPDDLPSDELPPVEVTLPNFSPSSIFYPKEPVPIKLPDGLRKPSEAMPVLFGEMKKEEKERGILWE